METVMNKEVVIRYNTPGKYDVAQHGTIYKVLGDDDSCELFVQLSEDSTSPNWKPISYLLEKIFTTFIEDKDFISHSLHLFSGFPEDRCKHLKAISEILIK